MYYWSNAFFTAATNSKFNSPLYMLNMWSGRSFVVSFSGCSILIWPQCDNTTHGWWLTATLGDLTISMFWFFSHVLIPHILSLSYKLSLVIVVFHSFSDSHPSRFTLCLLGSASQPYCRWVHCFGLLYLDHVLCHGKICFPFWCWFYFIYNCVNVMYSLHCQVIVCVLSP